MSFLLVSLDEEIFTILTPSTGALSATFFSSSKVFALPATKVELELISLIVM